MNTDCTYWIGRSHTVCEDYVIARGGEQPYVILADGCSSSPDTDLGARLLVRCAEAAGPVLADGTPAAVDAYHRETLHAAGHYAAGLGLDPRCLDATLLTLAVIAGRWLAILAGDGALAVKTRHGELRVTSVSFTGGYPEYLSYALDPVRRQAFEGRSGNRRRVERLLCGQGAAEVLSVEEERPTGAPFIQAGDPADTEWVAVLSDGVTSFTDLVETETSRTVCPLTLSTVLPELLAFRSRTGCFVQRRTQRVLGEWSARGRHHQDDFSIGAIAFNAESGVRAVVG
jgi:hypothetical protein